MRGFARRFLDDDHGATAIEYGLIAALIGVTVIGAVAWTGVHIRGTFENIAGNVAR